MGRKVFEVIMERPANKIFLLNHNCGPKVQNENLPLNEILNGFNGNIGNSCASYAVMKHVGMNEPEGIENIFDHRSLDSDVEHINENFSHVAFFLQDHLKETSEIYPWKKIETLLRNIKIPIIVFGLGANSLGKNPKELVASLSPTVKRFFQFLSARANALAIRGNFTAEVLSLLGTDSFTVTGCPSYYYSGPGRIIKTPKFNSDSYIAATGLFSSKYPKAHFFLQDEVHLIEAVRLNRELQYVKELLAASKISYTKYQDYFLDVYESSGVVFPTDFNSWRTMLANGNYSLSVGTRVHGSIMALNSEIPIICTNADSRAKEMFEFFGLPLYPGYALYETTIDELCVMSDPGEANKRYRHLYEGFLSFLTKTQLR